MENEKKIDVYIFFIIFPVAGNVKKKKLKNEKNKFGANRIGLLPYLYCDIIVCIVTWACWKCNGMERLYCNRLGWLAIVL